MLDQRSDWRLGLQSLDQELSREPLPVQGNVPGWFAGTLIRNGPGRFETEHGRARHWFFGLAMLHAFSFRAGHVTYTNRHLRTCAFGRATGETIPARDFALDPCRSLFRRVASKFLPRTTDNAVINIERLGGRFMALTESRINVEFEPTTLDALGVVDYDDQLTVHADTAHPHVDHRRGEALNHSVRFGPRSEYRVYRLPDDSRRRELLGAVKVAEPGYIHSFGLTGEWVVLVEFPLVIHPLSLLRRGRPFFENFTWHGDRSTRFLLLDRNSGEHRHTLEAPAVFAFHHVNAFGAGEHLAVDLVTYANADVINSYYLDALEGDEPRFPAARLQRFRLDIDSGRVGVETLCDDAIELPRINYAARNGLPYRFAYAGTNDPTTFATGLVKIDTETGATARWREPDCYPGEPVFVARPEGRGEDDGAVLSVVLDARSGTAFLLVLDAATFEERARAHVPHHIPFGFHGQFFPEGPTGTVP